MNTALGIDLGGTKILAALVANSQLLSPPTRIPTPKGPENITKALLSIISSYQKEHTLAGVGIATAGIVDPATGQVLGSTGNLPGWEGTCIKHTIESQTKLRTHVENDANAAAYGECLSGGFNEKTCMVMLTLGTGIGAGIVLNGKLYRGAHFAGGEVGHLKISQDHKRQCTCGLWDCWEAYGAGRGLVATGHELLSSSPQLQSCLAAKQATLTTEDIVGAAHAQDKLAQKAMHAYHEHIAAGMSCLCHTLDPDCFVITGGMSKFVDFVLLKKLLAQLVLPQIAEKLEIHPAYLGETAGLIGAAQLVLESQQASPPQSSPSHKIPQVAG